MGDKSKQTAEITQPWDTYGLTHDLWWPLWNDHKRDELSPGETFKEDNE